MIAAQVFLWPKTANEILKRVSRKNASKAEGTSLK